MARTGSGVWLLRRPDLSYLVRTSGRINPRTHPVAWAVTLETPDAARAAAEALEGWDRERLDRLVDGDRLLCRDAAGLPGWLPAEAAALRAMVDAAAELDKPASGLLGKLAGALLAGDDPAAVAAARDLCRDSAGPVRVRAEWADERFPATMPRHRALHLLGCALQALLVAALKDDDAATAARAAALAGLPATLLDGPLGG